MRLKYGHGETIPAGYYLRNDTWGIVCVPEDGALREGEDLTYYRVPLPVVLLLGPLAGLVWVFVYPLLGLSIVVYSAFRLVLAPLPWVYRRVSHRFAAPHGHR